MISDQFLLGMDNEIIVDLFAGGGGMSTAIERALGRHVDIAINHNEQAVSMHEANHPQTRHYTADVFEVCPYVATEGRPVGHLHGSPDCTHFSQAIGGQPRSRKIRGLGWVMIRWAGQVKPRSISMENVRQMQQWGPLIAKRDKATGRVLKLDGTIAAAGERVPVQEQFLIPDPRKVGRTWQHFIATLRGLGYQVEYRMMNAADYGAATTRERLFLFARRDGKPIVWPEPTHHEKPGRGQKKWRPAADHIDFTDLGQSIFTRKKELADATKKRIAKGMHKFVLNNPTPFIVELANWSNSNGVQSADSPLRTITATPKGGSYAMAAPVLVQAGHGDGKPGRAQRWGHGAKDITNPLNTITASGSGGQALAIASMVQVGYGEREGQAPRALDIEAPLGVITAGGGKHALTTAYLMQANGGFNETVGRELGEPTTTITTTGSQQQLVAAHLVTLRRNCFGREFDVPMATLTAGAEHHAVATYLLSKEHEEAALRCANFLINYYGNGDAIEATRPMPTATTRDRLALVTVWIKGDPWVIVDICLRMLKPRELYGCQGFPPDYIIDRGHDGRKFTQTDQVKMVGNSVSEPPGEALIAANCTDLAVWTLAELKQRERIAA